MEEIDIGLLSPCYVKNANCKDKLKVTVLKGEHKGQVVCICNEGCSKEERDCPYDK